MRTLFAWMVLTAVAAAGSLTEAERNQYRGFLDSIAPKPVAAEPEIDLSALRAEIRQELLEEFEERERRQEAAAEAAKIPLWVQFMPEGQGECPPCEALKREASDMGFRIVEVTTDSPPAGGYPYIRFKTEDGQWKGINGWAGKQTADKIARARTNQQPASEVRQVGELPDKVTHMGQTYYQGRTGSCGCSMCQTARAMLATPQTKTVVVPGTPIPAAQDPGLAESTDEDVARVLAVLELTPSDVFTDIGVGAGRFLIAAVEQYGVGFAIGPEIDPQVAASARRNVLTAESEFRIPRDRIQVVTTDALNFDPEEHGVTAGVVFLFEETLEELRPVLQKVPRLVSLYHEIPGLAYTDKIGDAYLYIND